jgi:hypothetical protein
MKSLNQLLIAVIIITIILILPFVVFFKNNKKQSHCNNDLPIGKIITLEKIGNNTIIELENNGKIAKEVINNYYYDIYHLNDSIIHCH